MEIGGGAVGGEAEAGFAWDVLRLTSGREWSVRGGRTICVASRTEVVSSNWVRPHTPPPTWAGLST